MTSDHHDATPPWAELLQAALHAAYRTMALEGEEIVRAFLAAQRISDARMAAGRAVGTARRAGWDGDHQELWRVAEGMAALGTIRHLPERTFLEREYDRWRHRDPGGRP